MEEGECEGSGRLTRFLESATIGGWFHFQRQKETLEKFAYEDNEVIWGHKKFYVSVGLQMRWLAEIGPMDSKVKNEN